MNPHSQIVFVSDVCYEVSAAFRHFRRLGMDETGCFLTLAFFMKVGPFK